MASNKKIIVYMFILALSIQNCIASDASESLENNFKKIFSKTPKERQDMEKRIRESIERSRRKNGIVSPVPQQ